MKLDRLETHDRLLHFTKQQFDIGECCTEVIKNRPAEFGNRPFYIFAHTRTDDDGTTQRLIWQPRLTRPKPQTNSMLFKAYPPGDTIKVIWIIPKRELWSNYHKGMMCENKTISDSIYDFQHNRKKLDQADPEDLDDKAANAIYVEIARNAKQIKKSPIL
jgi:hypothetical protein